jgi:NAD(P)-dependent dehydrogenase (short-subunit alcohol dehydrogenase family)
VSHRLKSLAEQVMVITGATSGIGLTTARQAADAGAKLVLAARNGDALNEVIGGLTAKGVEAVAVPTDVGDEGQVAALARAAVDRFGRFDTWVNVAGGSIYGHLTDVPTADSKRLFDTNFWGTVYGSLEAARHFRDRDRATDGALINLGSVLSDRAIPIQGMYCATKHAVKGFTDALRMELEREGVPVSVTLVKPSAIDTPFPQHAKNFLDEEPTLPPPLYAPEVVARTILICAERPTREVTVGGGGKAIVEMGAWAPRLTDRVMEAVMEPLQKKGEPPRHRNGALYAPGSPTLHARGDYSGPVRHTSAYTAAALHPFWALALAVGVGATLAAVAPDRR